MRKGERGKGRGRGEAEDWERFWTVLSKAGCCACGFGEEKTKIRSVGWFESVEGILVPRKWMCMNSSLLDACPKSWLATLMPLAVTYLVSAVS